MSRSRAQVCASAVAGGAVALGGVLIALLVPPYLSEYPSIDAAAVAGAIFAVGTGLAVFWLLNRRRSPAWGIAAAGLCLLLGVAVVVSLWSGAITYARFGLTVVGVVPVPMLDITIDSGGALGFRDKTHRVSLDEARSLVFENTDLLIIGNGWQGAVEVDREVVETLGSRVRVLESGAAVELYRTLRSRGKRVALLLHTTC